jgi:transporter family protein
VAPVDKLSVVFAIILAGLILKERIGWHQWTGGALIVAGAMLLALKN